MKIRFLAILFCICILPAPLPAMSLDILKIGGMDVEEISPASKAVAAGDILGLLYLGKSGRALSLGRRYIEEADPGDPLPHLMMARALREILPEQDDDKELIRESAAPIHDHLDEAIKICERGLKRDKNESRLLFYKGWAWMFKAQLHALGGSYWSAGRCAAKGNGDLKEYISQHPDDPDAKGILGTFLYFADTLPSVVKIIKTLFLIPGGDREKGLEYLRYACSHEGFLQTDHQIVLGAIYTIFEGRFEEGVDMFTDLLDRYPNYLRLVEPIAIVSTLYPGRIQYLQDLERSVIARSLQDPDAADGEIIQRLRYHHSYSDMYFESPALAINEFSSLIEEAPARPDWLVPLSLVNLGCLYANSGRMAEAEAAFQRVIDNDEMKHFHEIASDMMKSNRSGDEPLLAGDGAFIHTVYFANPGSAESALQDYQQEKGPTVLYEFYRGESMVLAGDYDAASRHFTRALDLEVPAYSQAYQMLAAVRMAEIMGMQGDYDAARKYLENGLHYYHKEFLIDMLIEGRIRFYERLKDGELHVDPSVLIASQPPLQAPLSVPADKISH